MNLLTNSIKFTPKGQSIQIRVTLLDVKNLNIESECSESIDGRQVHQRNISPENMIECAARFAIEIKDTGVGISEENLPKIFMDFMKLDEHSQMNPNGTGIGLSICKYIVEKMNGHISVQSKKEVGTTFRIDIATKIKLNKSIILQY